MDNIVLYHGSERIVQRPEKSKGKAYNDFGKGFYCTKDEDVAKEWACFDGLDGYVNKYAIDLDGLKIFDISKEKNRALVFLALMFSNRRVRMSSAKQKTAKDYLVEKYTPNISEYDIVVGARGDDSYFALSRAFLDGEISLGQLDSMLFSDKASEQIVLVSDKAFRAIRFLDVTVAEGNEYYYKRKERDKSLRDRVLAYKEKAPEYISEIIVR
ncbi:MAG: DUF3990 domain-containing protein [Clostridia bacterium]|nr:DUF3990 domain-containing protein [Clostridia bacterium]